MNAPLYPNAMEEQIFNLMDALNAPLITYTTSWADCIPKRIRDTIPMARIQSLIMKENMATLPEVAAYLITRTFEAPMSSEWVNIYTHVLCKVCEDYFNENHWDEITYTRLLNSDEQRYLKDLRVWIYERRRKALKDKLKSDNSTPIVKTITEAVSLPKQELNPIQLQFNF